VSRETLSTRAPGPALLTTAFGSTVAMWAVGYFGRLPGLEIPSPILLGLILACLPAGGIVLARSAAGTVRDGAVSGAVTGLLNLLVLGSFIGGPSPGRVVPSVLLWIPGSILLSSLLVATGAKLAGPRPAASERDGAWSARFAWVSVAATILLLGAGGLVTSAEAGLAVVDWPTSFGYSMFLYPFSRMTGGIYYEHAHRLIGALVGLTTLTLAVAVQRAETRRSVRWLAWALVAAVVVQGTLGGLRVTGESLALAFVHGVLAQAFFAALIILATLLSPRWIESGGPARVPSALADRGLSTLLLGLLAIQLLLGAAQRHFQELLLVHVVFGLGVVAPFGLKVAFRAIALHRPIPLLQRLGVGLGATLALQVVLGFGAWIATSAVEAGTLPREFDLVLATAHQWFGAILLGTAVLLQIWTFRLLAPPPPEGRL